MSDYLPKEIRDQLAAARLHVKRKAATLSVHVGDEAHPILDLSSNGFSVDADATPRLRGLIDIHDGPKHLYQALIVAAQRDGDVMRYDFKRNTRAEPTAPVDFEKPATDIAGLLSKA